MSVRDRERKRQRRRYTPQREAATQMLINAPVTCMWGFQSTEQREAHFAGESGASLHYSFNKHHLPAGADWAGF